MLGLAGQAHVLTGNVSNYSRASCLELAWEMFQIVAAHKISVLLNSTHMNGDLPIKIPFTLLKTVANTLYRYVYSTSNDK